MQMIKGKLCTFNISLSKAFMTESFAPTRKQHKNRSYQKVTKWNQKEDSLLLSLVKNSNHISWTELAPQFPGKTAQQISERWSKVVDPSLVKGGWTREEDETITQYVAQNGVKNWTKLAKLLPGRIGKQCRERWRNHLDPSNKSGSWTKEEDELLIRLHEEYGNSWVKIASFMEGRSDNCIKNRWNSTLKKRVLNGSTNSLPNPSSQTSTVAPLAPPPSSMSPDFEIDMKNNCLYTPSQFDIGNISLLHTPEKSKKFVDPPDSIPKPEWNGDTKLYYKNGNTPLDQMWVNPFDSPYLTKSPFAPFMKAPFSPWINSNEPFFSPHLMRSPHFSNDASHDYMDILDKE